MVKDKIDFTKLTNEQAEERLTELENEVKNLCEDIKVATEFNQETSELFKNLETAKENADSGVRKLLDAEVLEGFGRYREIMAPANGPDAGDFKNKVQNLIPQAKNHFINLIKDRELADEVVNGLLDEYDLNEHITN